MLTLDKVGIEIAGRWLMQNVSAQLNPGERVGLLGRNGAGKSTLLKAIAGERTTTEGRVVKPSTASVAYFHQELLSYQTVKSIFEVAQEGKADLLEIQAELNNLYHQMEEGLEDLDAWDRLAHLQAEFETRGGLQLEAEVHGMLNGLGFAPEQHDRPFQTFSGGWRMRVLLARMLLSDPSILLLDEPTNHLDLPSIQWLENYLKGFPGVCVLVSHDRFFMERMANRILWLTLGRVESYVGDYQYYLRERDLRKDLQQRAFENQQKMIETQEAFINRFRAKATKARQVQSRVKQLDKVDRLEAPEEEVVGLHFNFIVKEPSGKEVMKLSHVSKQYGDNLVIRKADGEIMRGDKIGLIGANGLGKSTLLRILTEREQHGGTVTHGYRVKPTFYAQHQLEALNLNHTVYEEVRFAAAGKNDLEVRTVLGCFMFSGEDADKSIRVLSGGEKSRVALAKTLVSEANFLLLDEPTNHLDMASIQVLIQALQQYEGTLVVVSHDRFFLQQVSNKIWYIEDKELKEYPGGYVEYDEWMARRALALQTPSAAPVVAAPVAVKVSSPVAEPIDYQAQKQNKNRLRKLEQDQQRLEQEAARWESEIARLENEMGSEKVVTNFALLKELQQTYEQAKRQYDETMVRWEEKTAELDAAQLG